MDNRPYKIYEVIANIMDNFNITARQKCLPQRVRITGIRRNVLEIVIMEKQIIIIMT